MKKVSIRECGSLIASHEPFSAGSLSATIEEHDQGAKVYVVKSYAETIATWTASAGWWLNERKYSATTTKHQAKVRNFAR